MTQSVPEDLAETAAWEQAKRPTEPDDRGDIAVQWNGPIVLEAPRRGRISLELVHAADPRALTVNGSTITVGRLADGEVVAYHVTGWDADHHCLLVERTTP